MSRRNPLIPTFLEIREYLWTHRHQWMTIDEISAVRSTSLTPKIHQTRGEIRSNVEAMEKEGWFAQGFSRVEIAAMTDELFKMFLTDALIKLRGDILCINLCPSCGRPARTPGAQQCRHCTYTWRTPIGYLRVSEIYLTQEDELACVGSLEEGSVMEGAFLDWMSVGWQGRTRIDSMEWTQRGGAELLSLTGAQWDQRDEGRIGLALALALCVPILPAPSTSMPS